MIFSQTGRLDCIEAIQTAFTVASFAIFELPLFILDSYDLLQTPTMKIYIGGDSGYDTHFTDIGNRFGEIDIAILDNGQYNDAWRYIHMHPDEVLKAAKDLKAKRLFPVHNSKFVLSNHTWNEPLNKITELNKKGSNIPLITPHIGETVYLKNPNQEFKEWWNDKQ